ncbi:hypothetical protein DSO57_1029438 [Entomophthora muscae]|uniref:Uncharacterized protein n=1 Tax=Entomophthora muscae TaxID=34485 RepID=A0ACC2S382_9FUNG|nr:hypothetical protein DSO57_1029438 [Entomophthora muscae]
MNWFLLQEIRLFVFLTLRNSVAPLMLVASDPTVLPRLVEIIHPGPQGFPVVCLCRASEHNNHTFGILGHSIPMFYHGNCLSDLPLRHLNSINLEYTDGELPVAYMLCSKNVKVLPLLVGEAKRIPVYTSCNVTIPPGSQVIHCDRSRPNQSILPFFLPLTLIAITFL